MVLVDRLNSGTVTALFIAYSGVACFGNLERIFWNFKKHMQKMK